MMDQLSRKDFDRHLHSVFAVRLSASVVTELELVETSGTAGVGMESFSIVFRNPGQQILPQKTYPLRHPALGALDLFLVPIKRDAQGVYYEAIFTRLTSSSATNRAES